MAKRKIKRREPTVLTSLIDPDAQEEIDSITQAELEEINKSIEVEESSHWGNTSVVVVDDASTSELYNGTIPSDLQETLNNSLHIHSGNGEDDDPDFVHSGQKRKVGDEGEQLSLGRTSKRHTNDILKQVLTEELPTIDLVEEKPLRNASNGSRTLRSSIKQHSQEYHPLLNTVYSEGKALFQRGSKSTGVIGRTYERQVMENFLISRLEARDKGALYISGLPGTGKSALLNQVTNEVIAKYSKNYPIRLANVNCMIMENAADIFTAIHRELVDNEIQIGVEPHFYEDYDDGDTVNTGRDDIITDGHLMQDPSIRATILDLEKRFFSKKHILQAKKLGDSGKSYKRFANALGVRHVVILDELDSIMTKDQEVLFRIFQWAFARDSSLILVGIANALDLTDRFLPRLRSSALTPQLLPFMPYTDMQIIDVISKRLWTLVDGKYGTLEISKAREERPEQPPLMDRAAITLCAKKTAANTGDLRKAFDICRRSIEMIEEDVRRKFAFEGLDPDVVSKMTDADWKKTIVSGKCFDQLAELTLSNAPRVTIGHVARVCSIVFNNNSTSRLKTLNLQQKAVLCTLASSEKKAQFSNKITVHGLYDQYLAACDKERDLTPLNYVDYMDVVSALESHGVLAVNGICGRKGLGSGYVRRSKGGHGSGTSRAGRLTEDYGQRRISTAMSAQDIKTELGKIRILAPFLSNL